MYQTDANGNRPGTQLKSEAAREAAMAILADIEARPFGTGRGENTNMPANYVPPPANIYLRNWSRTRIWKRLWIPVSARRGAEDALRESKKLREIYNVDTMSRKADSGTDMNLYKEEIFPVLFQVKRPGGPDGKMGSHPSNMLEPLYVPPSPDGELPPPKVMVPEGTWDIYCGNYERMRSADHRIKQEAQQQYANYWRYLHNPVFRITDDGVETDKSNPFGFIEIIREPIRQMETPMDKDWITAMDVFESN
jgi:hypothetical protein